MLGFYLNRSPGILSIFWICVLSVWEGALLLPSSFTMVLLRSWWASAGIQTAVTDSGGRVSRPLSFRPEAGTEALLLHSLKLSELLSLWDEEGGDALGRARSILGCLRKTVPGRSRDWRGRALMLSRRAMGMHEGEWCWLSTLEHLS